MNIAIVGATGKVGGTFIEVLQERNIKADNFYLFASSKSAGKKIKIFGREYTVIELTEKNVRKYKIDYALFSAGASVSKIFAPIFVQAGAVVIDNSSCWRMDKDVPLVVPEVNGKDAFSHKGIIANPNCSTIQEVLPIKALHKKYGIKRIIFSTYQAVSGAGQKGVLDLVNGEKGEKPKKFPHEIYNNVLPHIDDFLENGYTKEEEKMINETRKILHDDKLKITATTVRVPVINSHSESINVELKKPFDIDELKENFKKIKNLVVLDDVKNNVYPMPITASGHDEVFVGRIRRDYSVENGINMWVVADNIRKGAATNAVQILETLIKGEGK